MASVLRRDKGKGGMIYRRIQLFIIGLVVFSFTIVALPTQKAVSLIENSDTPLNPKAGWTLMLEEIFRITDESEDYYFRNPRNVQVGPKGCIYLTDKEQFLKFSSEGKFIRNMYKKGQGPGEIQNYIKYTFCNNKIYVYDFQPGKLICFDLEGKFIEEKRLKERLGNFFGCLDGRFIFLRTVWPSMDDRKGEFFFIENRICHIGFDGTQLMLGKNIPTKAEVLSGGGARFYPATNVRSTDGQLLYFNGSTDYAIDVINLVDGDISHRFSRKYQSVKYPEPTEKPKRPSSGMRPKYMRDIEAMFARKDSLWVATSKNDPEKGDLFDVFDMEGRYTDSFYVKGGGRVDAVFDEWLFKVERDEDGIYSIVKYRFKK